MSRTILTCVAVLVALVLLFVPFEVIFSGRSTEPIYNALAADAFYYAALARNFTEHGFFGIDGRTISNGYMPLWQMIVAALDATLAGPETPPQRLLAVIFVASALLIAVGVATLVLFIARRYGPGFALLTVPMICPGAAFFLLSHAYHEYLPNGIHGGYGMWSFANGMESGIGFALFAGLMPIAGRALDPEQATRRTVFWAGALTFFIMMARLDDVFVGIAFGICLLPLAAQRKDTRLLVTMAIVPLVGTAIYVALNSVYAGAPLPTSGALKTELFGFPNGWAEFSSIGVSQALESRMLPLTAALAIGLLGLLSQLRKGHRGPDTPIVIMLSLYLLLKAGFLLSSVEVYHQGYWYYTNMLAAMNLLIVIALANILRLSKRGLAVGIVVSLAIAFVAALNTGAQLLRYPPDSYITVSRDLCTAPDEARQLLPPDTGIIDAGDGVYAFCLGRPAVTLTGLADSREFIAKRNAKGIIAAAVDEGFDVIIDSPVLWASYDWRNLIVDPFDVRHLGTVGLVNVWQIVRK